MYGRRPRRPSARRRLLNATLELVAEGGYDALQVRSLADRAEVSSRTIYSYFPSVESLLIVAIAEQSQDLYRRYTLAPPRGRTPASRVQKLIDELTNITTANRTLTVALFRALLCGKPDVEPYVSGFRDVLQTMLVSAIAPNGPSPADYETAELLQAIWFTALIGWATNVSDDTHTRDLMRRATRRLLDKR